MRNKERGASPYVQIAWSLGIIFLIVVLIFAIFAKDSMVFLNSIVWAFVVLGIVLGAFQYKENNPSKSKNKK
ncbi:MAG: hypothetical protein WC812_00690 [Candidatus Pacearchaeota archaeon]|jgi:L-asparagine transporter-like permease